MENIKDIFKAKRAAQPKPPAYEWQDLALRIIGELGVPGFKRNSVFKVCKELPKDTVEKALNDTKELCQDGQCWKYFFKVIADISQTKNQPVIPADTLKK